MENANDFCIELTKNKCVISRSYILDCLYGTNNANDIDIIKKIEIKDEDDEWFHQNNCHTGYSYDIDNGNLQVDNFIKYLHHMGAKEIYSTGKHKLTRCILLNVRNYTINNKKIQFIMINQDIRKYIDYVFDMDICKNYFDGQKLYIKNLAKLMGKYDFYKPINSVAKYLYQPNNNNNISNECRINKYIKRDFNIQKHKNFDYIENLVKKYVDTYKLSILEQHHDDVIAENFIQLYNI